MSSFDSVSEDNRSDMFTVDTGYGTHTSPPSQIPSEWGSVMTVNTESSGIGSLAPLARRSSLYRSVNLAEEEAEAESDHQQLKQAELSASGPAMKKPVGSETSSFLKQ